MFTVWYFGTTDANGDDDAVNYRDYDGNSMADAILYLQSNRHLGIAHAANRFGVPRTTLSVRINLKYHYLMGKHLICIELMPW